MSTRGQIIGGIVGAVIGFFVTWNPYGAIQGAAIGAGIGMALDPPKGPTVSGPRLQDLSVQTSTYGVAVPRVHGTIGLSGNVLWIENNKLRERVRKKESGGKGGGSKSTIKTYSYSATFALGVCAGPISGIRRIWCSDKLIYNAGSDNIETLVSSNAAAQGFKIYLGTDDQLPDPRYEASVGVGNAPAFRGLAYIVFYDFQLADYSNTLQAAQFKIEVVENNATNGAYKNIEIQFPEESVLDNEAGTCPYIDMTNMNAYGATRLDSSFTSGAFEKDKVAGRRIIDRTNLFIPGGSGSSLVRIWHGYSDVRGFVVSVGTTANFFSDGLTQTFTSAPYAGATSIEFVYVDEEMFIIDHAINKVYKLFPSGNINTTITGANAIGPHPDGLAVLTTDDTVKILSRDDLSVIETLSVGMPSTGWTTAGRNGIRYNDDKFYVIQGATQRLFVIENGEISKEYVAPYEMDYNTICWNMQNNIFSVYNTTTATLEWWVLETPVSERVPLSQIITREVALSELLSEVDVDVSQITAEVIGYKISGGSLRSALEPLQAAYPFDIRQSGYLIEMVPRGQSSVMDIPYSDIGATDGGEVSEIFAQSREMDSQLPARTTIKYLDAAREYSISEQYSERLNTQAINRVDREMPLVLTADEASGVAEVLQFLPWLERNTIKFSLPPTYLALEPADVVTVTTNQADYELRIIDINNGVGGLINITARPNRAALYTPNSSGGSGIEPDGTIGLEGATEYQLLDIPVIDETLQDAPGVTLAMTGFIDWPGGILYRSGDTGQTWTDLQAITGQGTLGTAGAAMPARSGSLIDRGSSLTVYLFSGELSSITESQMLNGNNYAAYGVDGRWEIIRFANATLNADGTYTLDTFWRGDRGTEQYTGTHADGDYFILLDDTDNAFMGFPSAFIDVPGYYRGITAGQSIDTDTDLIFTYTGVNLECFSGVHPKGVRDGSANLTISWKRRTRVGGEWRDSVDASLGETSESYEIDIMNGSTVVRTITATTTSASYTAAQQTSDFGSTQSSVLVRIYQLSSVVGRGYKLEATI